MKILEYYFNLWLGPHEGEIDLETVESKLIGDYTINPEVIDSPSGGEWLMMNISPSIPAIVIDYSDKNHVSNQDKYELWFVEFLEVNAQILKEYHCNSFRINMNISCMKDKACFFDIFYGETLSRLCNFDVHLHTIINPLSKDEMDNLANTIK